MLFLRLYLLQGIRNYHSGNGEEARDYLNKVRKAVPQRQTLCLSHAHGSVRALHPPRQHGHCVCEGSGTSWNKTQNGSGSKCVVCALP